MVVQLLCKWHESKDIVCLKYKNINGDYLIFERAKTERTIRSEPKPISVFITEDIKSIIERLSDKDKTPNNFIFPIMEPGITPLQQYDIRHLFVSFINDWMKHILNKLGIDKIATTYVARHTFSAVLKRSGASTEYIQESVGHDIKKLRRIILAVLIRKLKKNLLIYLQLLNVSNEVQPE